MVWPWRCALLGAVAVVVLGRWLEGQPEVRQPESPWRFLVLFRTHPERVGVAVGLGLLALLPWMYPRPNLSEGVAERSKDPSDLGTARPP